jgi:SAM-dependent methyltransferase
MSARQDEASLSALAACLAGNRFMPTPPPELMLCGDGDFRAIGAEFLTHFVRRGSLSPEDRVLDLGCGVGRMALPLTQYLAGGTYLGLDVMGHAIAWCQQTITPVYPAFTFAQLDVAHPIYNPSGVIAADGVSLPIEDASVDFVALVSVLTHLDEPSLRRYAREIARVLAPGGRCFATAFLLNRPSREGIARGTARPPFPDSPGSAVLHADPEAPLAAIAFDEDLLLARFLEAGLKRKRPAAYGTWSGREHGLSFQDICIFEHG